MLNLLDHPSLPRGLHFQSAEADFVMLLPRIHSKGTVLLAQLRPRVLRRAPNRHPRPPPPPQPAARPLGPHRTRPRVRAAQHQLPSSASIRKEERTHPRPRHRRAGGAGSGSEAGQRLSGEQVPDSSVPAGERRVHVEAIHTVHFGRAVLQALRLRPESVSS